MQGPNGFTMKKAAFSLILVVCLFSFVAGGAHVGERYLRGMNDSQIASVADSALDRIFCRVGSWFGFGCVESEVEYAPATPLVIETENPAPTLVNSSASVTTPSTTTIEYVTNETIVRPIERETVREVVIRDQAIDTARFITREEYDRQIDALLRSIENTSRSSRSDEDGSDISGTVTSVGLLVPDFLTVANSPITASGTITLSLTNGYTVPITASTTEWDQAYAWGDHSQAGYLTSFSESDPIFSSSTAASITGTNVSNWNTAFSWGDHSAEGYLTAETDPVFASSSAASIDNVDISNWNQAHAWGNHASEGYIQENGNAILGNATTSNLHVENYLSTNYLVTDLSDGCVEVVSGVLTSIGLNCGTSTSSAGLLNLNGLTSAGQTFNTNATGGLSLSISSAGSVHTFNLGLASGRSVPLSASTTEWAEAFSWGDHALAGYLTSVDVSDDTNLGVSATGLSLSEDNITLTTGYTIPLSASTSEWNTAYAWGDHSAEGYLTGIGTTTFTGNISMAGHIIPVADITYDLGSPERMWKDVYIGPGSLYINGKKVLEDVSNTITFTTDNNQNLAIETSGMGSIGISAASTGNLNLSTQSGNINITSASGNINLSTVTSGIWHGTDIDISDYTNLGVTATGLALSGDNIALTDGYSIPLIASTSQWGSAYASTTALTPSYIRGLFSAGTGLSYSNGQFTNAGVTSIGGLTGAVSTSSLGITSSQWTTSGSNIYYSTGNVGIGTTSPSTLLHLSSATPILRLEDTDMSGLYSTMSGNGGSLSFSADAGSVNAGSNISFSVYGTEHLRILNNGNVGIGTSSPNRKLTVFNTAAEAQQRLLYDATRYAEFYVDATGDLNVSTVGKNLRLLDGNLYVCDGGACPSTPVQGYPSTFDDQGNAVFAGTVYSDGTAPVTCPTGMIPVPPAPEVGMHNGFCVDKYEAQNDGSNNAVSVQGGSPWVSITQYDARAQCLRAGKHLITESEWLAIARHVEDWGWNWQGGTAGTNQMSDGHSDSGPGSSLATAADSSPCSGTGQSCDLSTWNSQRRVYQLPNEEYIWDFAGNVWEWVDEVNRDNYPIANSGTAGSQTCSTAGDGICGNTLTTNDIWYRGQTTDTRGFARGGHWADGTGSGAFALALTYAPGNTATSFGFRCAQ